MELRRFPSVVKNIKMDIALAACAFMSTPRYFRLREIPGMQFRTDNAPFKREMYRFLAHMVDYTRDSFWENGGPVILLQIENEYGNVEREYGEAGHAYIEWAAAVAKGYTFLLRAKKDRVYVANSSMNTLIASSFDTSLPWFMCQQDNVSSLINACNGFYCDEWVGRTRKYMDQPGMFTENWTGWFTAWGEVKPTRPAEDLAFSVARWFARGGTYNAYYMWFGGTNFGRSAGRWDVLNADMLLAANATHGFCSQAVRV